MHNELQFNNPADTGLGNTLFQLASQYAFSKDANINFNVYDLDEYCDRLRKHNYDHDKKIFTKFFNKFSSNKINKDKLLRIEEYTKKEYKPQTYNNQIIEIIKKESKNNLLIHGYFQSHKYFNKYKNELINLFDIDSESLKFIKEKYPLLFDKNFICISIHIRMNYANNINFNRKFFDKAIKYVEDKIEKKNIHYFIFSNDLNKVNKWYNDSKKFTYVKNKMDYLDLWVMSLCKHNIISFSTFSWWGAYLNKNPDKIVIYPNDALKITGGNLYEKEIFPNRKEDFFMKEWINLDIDTCISKKKIKKN